MLRKTFRVFIIIYLILLPLSIVAAYFLQQYKVGIDGNEMSFPLMAVALSGAVLLWQLFLFYIFLAFWSLFDLMKSEFTETHNKILWFILIILLPLIGTIFYLIISPKQKIEKTI